MRHGRVLVGLLAAVTVLLSPAAAVADCSGAGDCQYEDPLGQTTKPKPKHTPAGKPHSGQAPTSTAQTTTPTPASGSAAAGTTTHSPASTTAAQSAASSSATGSSSRKLTNLPRTGTDARLPAALGGLSLLLGVGRLLWLRATERRH